MDLQPINLSLPEHVRAALNDGTSGKARMSFAMNAASDDEVELLVMDFVGDRFSGLSADQISRNLAEARDKRVHVRINSGGGLAYDGLAIFNALLKHPGGTTTTVEGLAGSAASLIAQAGKPRRMMANANQFIHRSMGAAMGNAIVMRDVADFLDALDEGIMQTYVARTGLSQKRVNELLTGKVDGTNMTAKEALELGFTDEIVDLKPAKPAKNAAFTVPQDSPSGAGAAQPGNWKPPTLADFTADSWEQTGPNTRAAIAKHYAIVPENLAECQFEDLHLPHHDPDGKANLAAVQDGLVWLGSPVVLSTLGVAAVGAARAHLEAHLPVNTTNDLVDRLHAESLRRLAELRLAEIGA